MRCPFLLLTLGVWVGNCNTATACLPELPESFRPAEKQVSAIQGVIHDIEKHEGLYRDIAVDVRTTYQLMELPFGIPAEEGAMLHEERNVHYVHQGDRFRIESNSIQKMSGRERTRTRLKVFDGTRTQSLSDNGIVNVLDGPVEGAGAIRPHMALLYPYERNIRLSTYLKGVSAIITEAPREVPEEHLEIVSSYQGTANWRSIPCQRVFLDIQRKKGKDPISVRWEFWLAETRNYIPIRMLSYTFRYSRTLPMGEGEVTEFVEVKPGVWFPATAHVNAYREDILQDRGELVLKWKRTFTASHLTLDPEYESDYFELPDIPEKANVYHVDKAGIITDSYRAGDVHSPQAAHEVAVPVWIYVVSANVIVFILIVCGILRRACRKK